ncbi:MAG: LysM peptidoglycan-binding domain-containing protein, partial [Deltaproteobacteria bacterium]
MSLFDFAQDALAAVEAAKAQKAGQASDDPAAHWKQQEETIEDALENAGISGVDVQIDAEGFATLKGAVGSEEQQQLAVSIAEQFELNGMAVELEVADVQEAFEDMTAIWADVAKSAQPQMATYTTKKGDSWWGIAARFYGDGTRWKKLKRANGWPRMLHPDVELKIPSKEALEEYAE